MYYGVDVGGTKIETGIFDEKLVLQESWRVATPTENYQDFLDTIHTQISIADEKTGEKALVGLGMPGVCDAEGRILSANISWADKQNIGQDLSHALNRAVAFENDSRCFTLSEAHGGAGDNFTRVLGVILGTGAAGGLCVNGNIENGPNRILGEFCHIPLPASLQQKYTLPIPQCGCGLTGCIEGYVSGTGLKNLYKHFVGNALSGEEIIGLLRKNDPHAVSLFDTYMDLLGSTIGSAIQHYDPDVIVLGGGMSNVEEILTRLPQSVQPYLFNTIKLPSFVKARYGDASGVRGAAILAQKLTTNL